MKLGRYLRWCFLRDHVWIGADGKPVPIDRGQSTNWEDRPRKVDRACANCEKVELHESDPAARREIAAKRIGDEQRRIEKKKQLEIAAAKSGPHPRALTSAEREIEELLKRAGSN